MKIKVNINYIGAIFLFWGFFTLITFSKFSYAESVNKYFQMIKEGMTQEQLIEKMGKPIAETQFVKNEKIYLEGIHSSKWDEIKEGEVVIVWAYKVDNGYLTAFIVNNNVLFTGWGNHFKPFDFIINHP